ncbi:MAG: L,D-transpeptidase family protein [Thermodesulfovibrionales bacterium]|nr:L,D-transpeptidase family protein [Thermodesulfovibrionales bacterium]
MTIRDFYKRSSYHEKLLISVIYKIPSCVKCALRSAPGGRGLGGGGVKLLLVTLFLIFLISASSSVYAGAFSFCEDNTVIGFARTYKNIDDRSLIEIAREFGIGYNEIVDANPDLCSFVPGKGVSVKIPTLWILPDVYLAEGIVINLSEKRLYLFFEQGGVWMVRTFPVAVGRKGWETPLGDFRIIEILVGPPWHVPKSIRKIRPWLPAVVPPGPDNPLSSHALRLCLWVYSIHGTNRPWSIGRSVTAGCVRLYPEDIPVLFRQVSIDTSVIIVRQPIKVGTRNERVYIEVHRDPWKKDIDFFSKAVELLKERNLLENIDTKKLYNAVKRKSGVPVVISK